MGFEKTYPVRWSDVDANGHMRNTAYSECATDARIAFFREAGFGWRRFEELGLSPVLLREEIDYRREAGLGDQVRVTVQAAGLSPDGARWKLRSLLAGAGGEEMALVSVLGASSTSPIGGWWCRRPSWPPPWPASSGRPTSRS